MPLFHQFGGEFQPLFHLINEVDKAARGATKSEGTTFKPKCDVKEHKENYSISLEVPGISQDNISIEWTDINTLSISGTSETRKESGKEAEVESTPSHHATVEDDSDADIDHMDDVKERSPVPAKESQQAAKSEEEQPKTWVSERQYGSFRRTFSFPVRIDQDEVKAKLNNGVLEISIPKLRRDNEKRTIAIE